MKALSFLFAFAFVTLFLASCGRNSVAQEEATTPEREYPDHPNAPLKQTYYDLEGSWRLYRIDCCGRMMDTLIVPEEHPEKVLNFSKSQVIVTSHDEKEGEKQMRQYTISQDEQGQMMIDLSGGRKGYLRIEDNKMIIDYSYMDLPKEYYKRLK